MTLRGGGGKERKVRADAAEFLSLATGRLSDYDRTAVVKNRSLWHSTQRRSVGQLTHIIGGVHLGVEDVLQQATPMPTMRPRIRPAARYSGMFGELCPVGV